MNAHTTDRWKAEQRTKALRKEPITETFARRRHTNWLREMLKGLNIRYRDFTVGREARVITTDFDKCPCCNRPMEVK